MRMLIKKIVCIAILVYFLVAMMTACSTQRYTCATYASHHSNLYAKYKVRN